MSGHLYRISRCPPGMEMCPHKQSDLSLSVHGGEGDGRMATIEQRRKRANRVLFGTGLALSYALAFPAYAQTAPEPVSVEEPPQEAADQIGADIVVTAQRREERLQDVPLSISAFSGDALQSAG